VEAGRVLGERLAEFRGKDVVVLGIPRGGVPVADEVARRLNARLDIVVARKLGSPYSEELGIGAVTANGGVFLNDEMIRTLRVPDDYVNKVKAAQMSEARRREERFRGSRPAPVLAGRIVMVVDDGLATGATMIAALRSVRLQKPARLIAAVPVGSSQACGALRGEADEVVCLRQPEPFGAIGFYYQDFGPTEDAEVDQLLKAARSRPEPPAGVSPGPATDRPTPR
jgi:putative phosphoribosyl transferase